jgi:Cdc6-like AAA superfamily ATPase
MVRSGELVLDDQNAVVGQVLSDQVERESADGMLVCGQLEINAEHISEKLSVLEQPWSEVQRFVLPNVTHADGFELPQLHLSPSGANRSASARRRNPSLMCHLTDTSVRFRT